MKYNINFSSMKFFVVFVYLSHICVYSSEIIATSQLHASLPVVEYLLRECSQVMIAQNQIRHVLLSHGIPISTTNVQPSIASQKVKQGNSKCKVRIALSTELNNLECRVALGRAPVGRKLIAPCSCSGSQEWIQFSEFNRLRRKDPSQWIVCQTCQQKYEYDVINLNGGVIGNLITSILDHKNLLRSITGIFVLSFSQILPTKTFILRLITSRVAWQSVNIVHV